MRYPVLGYMNVTESCKLEKPALTPSTTGHFFSLFNSVEKGISKGQYKNNKGM